MLVILSGCATSPGSCTKDVLDSLAKSENEQVTDLGITQMKIGKVGKNTVCPSMHLWFKE